MRIQLWNQQTSRTMEDYRRTIDGVSLSEEDIYNLEMWNWALGQNGNESVSEFASRFGEKYDPEWREQSYDPCLHAITAFYSDNALEEDSLNSELSEAFATKIFRLGRPMNEAVSEARLVFNDRIKEFKSAGTIKESYDTEWLFRAYTGIFVWEISQIRLERLAELRDSDFYKDGIFSKYHITALSYADDISLQDFEPQREYDEFDIEVMLVRVGIYDEDTGLFVADKMKLYDKVKSIVTKNPDQPLKDAKLQLEELAKADGNLKCDLAYFYACAVIEWHLNGNNSQ